VSRISRTAKLILTARAAARGASVELRLAAILEMARLAAPMRETVGVAKFKRAWDLKDKVALLYGLDGVARTELADRVVEIAAELQRMPDCPPTDENPETMTSESYWLRN
jgi:hypothetical protein